MKDPSYPFIRPESSEIRLPLPELPLALPQPYSQFASEDKPAAEVCKTHFICKGVRAENSSLQLLTAYLQTFKKATRTAELRRGAEAHITPDVVHVLSKTDKAQRIRQSKNVKPKDTNKRRIDNCTRERERRNNINDLFSFLCHVLPGKYLRKGKKSSRITKKQILEGVLQCISEESLANSLYKSLYCRNKLLRERLLKEH
ncbi:hypothetical protein AVEN_146926-1 [Araneus ventricosus]|uniref:BHLH domain-containing protein n=1 Tax=Araneus ventricosus TaxID=182803 RepID=A0A4Y2NT83_ARAVE|nr:hypothetical protein AVEN_146926-1 [Araneus ventricosus]